jgi:hypothetical protein
MSAAKRDTLRCVLIFHLAWLATTYGELWSLNYTFQYMQFGKPLDDVFRRAVIILLYYVLNNAPKSKHRCKQINPRDYAISPFHLTFVVQSPSVSLPCPIIIWRLN